MKRVHGGIQRWNSMALHREENKVPLRQSPKCKWIIARVVIGSEIATTKGDVTASWRQRNLSGWRVRQYELTTSLRQRRRRAISQWIGVILYGLRLGHAEGVPEAFNAVLSYLWKRTTSSIWQHTRCKCSQHNQTMQQIQFFICLCCEHLQHLLSNWWRCFLDLLVLFLFVCVFWSWSTLSSLGHRIFPCNSNKLRQKLSSFKKGC